VSGWSHLMVVYNQSSTPGIHLVSLMLYKRSKFIEIRLQLEYCVSAATDERRSSKRSPPGIVIIINWYSCCCWAGLNDVITRQSGDGEWSTTFVRMRAITATVSWNKNECQRFSRSTRYQGAQVDVGLGRVEQVEADYDKNTLASINLLI